MPDRPDGGRRARLELPAVGSTVTARGKTKVATQWQLDCLVHGIEQIATRAMRVA